MKKSFHKMLRKFRRNLRYRWFRTLILQWCFTGIVMVGVSVILCSALFPKQVNAGENGVVYYKYYQNIRIEKGDTLWKYAEIYRSPEMSKKDYVREVEFINDIENGQMIAGKSITIPYYSTEYICSEISER